MDRKADKAQEHGEQLRRDREVILEMIAGYQRHIDGCTAEMSKYKLCIIWNDESFVLVDDCERRIDEYRARIRAQQDLVTSRRAEAVSLRQEAAQCRAQADSWAIL